MELEFVEWLRSKLPPDPRLRLGIGDDAAVIDWAAANDLVVSVDLLTEDVDFRLADAPPRHIGHKALAVSLSDMAAMAAKPVAAVIAIALPRSNSFELAVALYEGMLPLAARYDLTIAGGDTNTWDGPLVLSTTVFGAPTGSGPLKRDGARPGDRILVTGALGGSIRGRHLTFEPRVSEAIELHSRYQLHACIDISDGLALDLSRICNASQCGAIVDVDRVPISDDARAIARDEGASASALDHALSDGEDFELLLAVKPAEAERMLREQPLATPLADIGEFAPEPGLWRRDANGASPLAAKGYTH